MGPSPRLWPGHQALDPRRVFLGLLDRFVRTGEGFSQPARRGVAAFLPLPSRVGRDTSRSHCFFFARAFKRSAYCAFVQVYYPLPTVSLRPYTSSRSQPPDQGVLRLASQNRRGFAGSWLPRRSAHHSCLLIVLGIEAFIALHFILHASSPDRVSWPSGPASPHCFNNHIANTDHYSLRYSFSSSYTS